MSASKPLTALWRQRLLAFGAALLLATAWGTLVQTQINLTALTSLGVEVPLSVRARTSAQDLAGFGPVYAGIVLAAWLPAFGMAAWLARGNAARRGWLYPLAAGVGLVVAIRVADAVAPMPVLIDATRSTAGLLAMALGAVLGGGLFVRLTR
ncbi:hypothetical protein [Xylophilus sp. Leaf220]|uniref:hypothetical protein n=1 Tax=Xylophilus sp. Leaf220 TaxID=1735686 RepID=UPI0006F4197F|nr:hypothetical protein [Xylophilus sp. Leaf220]KQM78428.1 hypothetical protein ASE76_17405 [Xylophilus sp. Leaf220]